MVAHNVNHSTQHRSGATQMATNPVHSPGDLDISEIFPTWPIGG